MDLASAADHNDRVIDPSRETYRTVAERQLSSAVVESRTEADMIASFASDAVVDTDRQGRVYTNKEGLPKLAATSFQFARGSGHQYFLGTVYQLMERLDAERIQKMLFQRWDYSDEKLALRWDPIEDRRYALMDKDPTASDRKVKSMWMANLLAYRGLQLFPSVPTTHGLETTGWSEQSRRHFFRWPLWSVPVGFDALRTLLVLDELHQTYLDKKRLKETGITAVYVSERIRVGSGANFKFNFAPAQLA